MPYNAADAALLARARGLRVRLTGPLLPGQTFRLSYNVVVRDGIARRHDAAELRRCHRSRRTTDQLLRPGGDHRAGDDEWLRAEAVQPVVAAAAGSRPSGQQSQLQVRIQNNGSLYLNRLVVTDTDADFFDAVDWVGPMVVNAPPGANRARLEVCTTGLRLRHIHRRRARHWRQQHHPRAAGRRRRRRRPGVPCDVHPKRRRLPPDPRQQLPDELVGASSASVCVTVQARETLRSAPTTPIPATLANTASGAGESINQTPGTTFPIGDTTATIVINEGTASMDIDKGPQSRIAPGESAPLSLDIENTGTAPIPDLVVVDPIPDGLNLDQIFAGGEPGRPFRITYDLPAGVAPPTNVVYETVPDPTDPNRIATVRWSFPGFNLPPGGRVIIDFQVLLEPGTPANTVITNVAGVSSSRPDVACTPDAANDGTVTDDPAFGTGLFCTSSTTITALQGTAFSSAKWVSGDESLGWVYTLDAARPRVPLDDPRCPRLFIDGDDVHPLPVRRDGPRREQTSSSCCG